MVNLIGEISTAQQLIGEINIGGIPPTLIQKSITSNGTYNALSDNADGYSSVVVNVESGGSTPTLQEKSATPSLSSQEIVADNNYDGLSKVNIAAITSTLLASLDADFVAGNVKKDVDLFGLVGSYEGSGGVEVITGSFTPSTDSNTKYSVITDDAFTGKIVLVLLETCPELYATPVANCVFGGLYGYPAYSGSRNTFQIGTTSTSGTTIGASQSSYSELNGNSITIPQSSRVWKAGYTYQWTAYLVDSLS